MLRKINDKSLTGFCLALAEMYNNDGFNIRTQDQFPYFLFLSLSTELKPHAVRDINSKIFVYGRAAYVYVSLSLGMRDFSHLTD